VIQNIGEQEERKPVVVLDFEEMFRQVAEQNAV